MIKNTPAGTEKYVEVDGETNGKALFLEYGITPTTKVKEHRNKRMWIGSLGVSWMVERSDGFNQAGKFIIIAESREKAEEGCKRMLEDPLSFIRESCRPAKIRLIKLTPSNGQHLQL